MLRRLKYLIQDPPPPFVFEISERSVVGARRNARSLSVEAVAHRELPPGTVEPAAGRPNVLQPDELREAIRSLLEELGPARRPDAALILPDASARLTVLEFEQLPADPKERLRLFRWRLKKSLPFDVELARLAYHLYPLPEGGVAALVAVSPPEVIHQYETPFEENGIWPGSVSLSASSALSLVPDGRMTLFVKLAARSMTMSALEAGVVRMIRCVDLPSNLDRSSPQALDDVTADIYPTCVFIGDNLGSPVSTVMLCGFQDLLSGALARLPRELGCPVEALRWEQGVIEGDEAGLWGYLNTN